VYNRTDGSLLLAALLHGAINGSAALVNGLLPDFNDALRLRGYGALALAFTVVALALVIATRGRLGYPRGDATPGTDAHPLFGSRAMDRNRAAR
jgi:hypothetical protein